MDESRIVAMKLRIRGNSLRFRLTQKEVARLLAGDKISEAVHFSSAGSNLFTYSLWPSDQTEQLTAGFENNEILATIPVQLIRLWGNSEQVGMESMQPLADGNGLRIVIEKDFRCLQPRSEEDESDNFPNPEQTGNSTSGEATGK